MFRGVDGALFHGGDFSMGDKSKNFTTEVTECTEFGAEGTCPLVQFLRRNCAIEAAIFSLALTYYLVQENPDVRTQHGYSNRGESRDAP